MDYKNNFKINPYTLQIHSHIIDLGDVIKILIFLFNTYTT